MPNSLLLWKHRACAKIQKNWNVNNFNDLSIEIRTRIEITNSFKKIKQFCCDRTLVFTVNMRMLRCYIYSILLYIIETTMLFKAMIIKVQVLRCSFTEEY